MDKALVGRDKSYVTSPIVPYSDHAARSRVSMSGRPGNSRDGRMSSLRHDATLPHLHIATVAILEEATNRMIFRRFHNKKDDPEARLFRTFVVLTGFPRQRRTYCAHKSLYRSKTIACGHLKPRPCPAFSLQQNATADSCNIGDKTIHFHMYIGRPMYMWKSTSKLQPGYI